MHSSGGIGRKPRDIRLTSNEKDLPKVCRTTVIRGLRESQSLWNLTLQRIRMSLTACGFGKRNWGIFKVLLASKFQIFKIIIKLLRPAWNFSELSQLAHRAGCCLCGNNQIGPKRFSLWGFLGKLQKMSWQNLRFKGFVGVLPLISDFGTKDRFSRAV